MWPWHMWSGWGWGGILISIVFLLLFMGIIATLAFFALRGLIRSGQSGGSWDERPKLRQTPLEILQERYARGEISRQEYQEMRHDLEN